MLAFESDYIEGAHERILQRFIETNMEKQPGYGFDTYCDNAKAKIREACNCPDADITFITGGTQTNSIVIDAMLHGYEAAVAATTGHIEAHEAGAVEYTGHKVLTVPGHQGKIDATELNTFLRDFFADDNCEHMAIPGLVYISHPTEYGTLYTREELTAIANVCHQYKLPLFLDGARLGYGLMSKNTDVTLPFLCECCDAFYIGGTKCGALCGEAVVFPRHGAPKHFFTSVKQHGALLAKGRLLGIQFETLFTDHLYFDICKHAIDMAELLKTGLAEKNYAFFLDSPTNQQFIILENKQMEALKEKVRFGFWEKYDDTHTVVRFATSWATKEEDIRALLALL